MNAINWLAEALSGRVVVDIGQIDARSRLALDRAAKRGELVKWRGFHYPDPFGTFGLGPLKTCYAAATPQTRALVEWLKNAKQK